MAAAILLPSPPVRRDSPGPHDRLGESLSLESSQSVSQSSSFHQGHEERECGQLDITGWQNGDACCPIKLIRKQENGLILMDFSIQLIYGIQYKYIKFDISTYISSLASINMAVSAKNNVGQIVFLHGSALIPPPSLPPLRHRLSQPINPFFQLLFLGNNLFQKMFCNEAMF